MFQGIQMVQLLDYLNPKHKWNHTKVHKLINKNHYDGKA